MQRMLSPGKHTLPKLSPTRQRCTNPYLVPQPKAGAVKPDMSLFQMRDSLQLSANTEALQKFAFTEIWIERQQTSKGKRSLHRQLSAALDDYFDKKGKDQFEDLSLQEQHKSKDIETAAKCGQSSRSSSPPAMRIQYVPETEPYISPFEDFIAPAPEVKIPGERPYTIVPAGYDLTRLVEYKDPNHWHRRPTTRYDTRP
ncbi:hypothetical protein KR222_006481 [Zaprionus bogoriensis]|nr:hypothetical protein KR222_006481 [Zaprionus bogoriensis]